MTLNQRDISNDLARNKNDSDAKYKTKKHLYKHATPYHKTINMKNQNLETLIHEYLTQVKKATNLLEQTFGTKNTLQLWCSKKIPQRGRITDNISYELHGVGCRVDFSGVCIDFDYGPNERVDGFDPWRLYIYACEVPHRYKKYTNQNTLKLEFNNYVAQGKAQKIADSMSNLYFLNLGPCSPC